MLRKVMLLVAMLAIVLAAAGPVAATALPATGAVPFTGGSSHIAVGAGALLVAAGLIARRIFR